MLEKWIARFCTLLNASCASVTLKDEQTACVKAIYKGKDTFLWPTGFGKSMCYEVLPFVFDDKQGRRDRTTSYWSSSKM